MSGANLNAAVINAAAEQVLFSTLATDSGKRVGVATLNIEKALNALNLNMVQLLTAQLTAWRDDDNIVAVVLDGAGEKAFCAGGDVRAIYQASVTTQGEVTEAATEFFKQEYELDYLLHRFGKPVAVWGDGIVMGGGLGLMIGASHRIVTECSRIAMPEVTIGLYPDVGGSYFLNRMPGKSGQFLGMTAYNMSGADALYVGIGNHYLNHDDRAAFFDALVGVNWCDSQAGNHQALHDVLDKMRNQCSVPVAVSVIEQNQGLIDELMAGSLDEIMSQVSSLDEQITTTHPWLAKAIKTLLAGSPISLSLVHLQSGLGEDLSLADCFKLELGLSVNCCAKADFAEGVRALLIDKDRNPQWRFADIASIPQGYAQELLQSPWDDKNHPLKAMG
ncbi:enoyl-CoA hydratase/isomerase family protein [Shewanella schlegeliana]|uniref:3-hydroxyisobutyryl-CoA hydrolase n=1 Tax=Shewanella schlegeliana TaxID=190308 RepID=A0ABS1SXR5_9GAMM|nr:enoyl-CoA hydratase/isomerase family protein [Shewanella schlegeliana]MBL4913333.1 enoyl-CoA hydratase/isomerase family protein [Shewanella schlegeliana]MCL1109288.1 enoyl-CoA hydratase/isomerase family protein [Shewanella schlegeliana]GIU24745.1 enoyl-CoA hydratase [Shewanella schlegeliana]